MGYFSQIKAWEIKLRKKGGELHCVLPSPPPHSDDSIPKIIWKNQFLEPCAWKTLLNGSKEVFLQSKYTHLLLKTAVKTI